MLQQPETPIPGTDTLKQEAVSVVARASGVTITSHEEYERTGAELVRVACLRKQIVDWFKDMKERAFQAHRAICKRETELLQYAVEAERIIKGAIGIYLAAEEKRRREEQARISAELKRQEEDRLMAEAETLAASGNTAEAEALLGTPVCAPVVELAAPHAAGVSTRRRWGYRVIDEKAIKREFLTPDEKKIRQTVTALGPDAAKLVGGIEVLEERTVAVRT